MQWKFENEIVPPEIWQWVAKYNDGSELKQFDDEGIFHQFKEIDQERLYTFSMNHIEGEERPFILLFPERGKLIHFYRNKWLNLGTEQEKHYRLYCFGYELDGVKVINVIMPDNQLIITDDIERVRIK